jgi:hypothetical protein
MKKVLIIMVILTAPFLMVALSNSTSTVNEEVITITPTTTEAVNTNNTNQNTAEAKFKAQANDMNYKKSNDIISIKAYRKSLQIKVKEVKIC